MPPFRLHHRSVRRQLHDFVKDGCDA
jgi:hypothetical protein